jgi:N4-gp56 family major capsid protein
MASINWTTNSEGGYTYAPELSKVLRMAVRALTKFRMLCDAKDASGMGMRKGSSWKWNVYKRMTPPSSYQLSEFAPIPQANFEILQNELTIQEYGRSVPFTELVTKLGKHEIVEVIEQVLKDDAAHCFDAEAFDAFDATPLRVAPTGGTSTSAVTLTTNGATATTNNVALRKDHVKAIGDTMSERNIPPYMGDDYMAISHVSTLRTFKNDLESIHQYVETGYAKIMRGEIGRYDRFRFIEQNNIPKGGANDSGAAFSAQARTADPWDNGLSSWAFFMGRDTVKEAIVHPLELRAKIPADYGRDHGIAWYALEGFGIVHPDAANARIVKWDSAA